MLPSALPNREFLPAANATPPPETLDASTALQLEKVLEGLRDLTARIRQLDPAAFALATRTTPTDLELKSFSVQVRELRAASHQKVQDFLALLPRGLPDGEAADITEIVRTEVLREHQTYQELEQAPSTQLWQVAVASLGLVSKVLKGIIAIENSLSALLGQPRQLTLASEKDAAIAVRQAYCKFWRSLAPAPPADAGELEARLRSGGTTIARLMGRPVFLDLRYSDRRLLMVLQRRIRKWLISQGQTENGINLWQELVAFGCLLAGINNRSELVEFDQETMMDLMHRTEGLAIGSDILPRFREALNSLLGRDPLLDNLLLAPTPMVPVEKAREIFCRHLQRRPVPTKEFVVEDGVEARESSRVFLP